ncbi:MAG: bifunctional [glutamine synthetase] adenylyltransferase/[glutamine synthetase]-adenylyl-L-tyrosine phosphorylase [Proteobacteria bacterium]|nr:bifunctional [glutamine synthetase] adenylyltransferase/[glutamine synthetase]-adenylyl-L-tyrosine phosphorylase [Pseudomonadota bacterium]
MQDMDNRENFPFTYMLSDLPSAGDPQLLEVGLQDWPNVCIGLRESEIPSRFQDHPDNMKVLEAIFGNSPYLSQCLLSNPDFFLLLMRHGPDRALENIYAHLSENIAPSADRQDIMASLRQAKQCIALLTAICDMGHVWSLMEITGTLSVFADYAVEACCNHLLWSMHQKSDIILKNPENPTKDSGLIVLGLGKLGSFELNYSSDIDLIILFDPEKISYCGRKSVQDCFVKIARNLVQMMQERTADGYVFRTDLRLRPDPGATPIALSIGAAHVYYESQGQNWERAAMIKARAIAGDIAAGMEFVDFLTPFIWRKSMDFAAIEDIQAIKSQIHAHKGFSSITLDGHNIKIGRGGIREIEFFCQTQQLIEGGRKPSLRTVTTLNTLDQLFQNGLITKTVLEELSEGYIYLRTLEHRLQMVHDEQTQTLPESAEDLDKLGIFFGYDDSQDFRTSLHKVLSTVQKHYDALFEFEKTSDRKVGRLVFTGSEDDPETLKSLEEIGFTDTSTLSQKVRDWHHGRYRATRAVRTQQILTELMPQLLEALADTTDPDTAFNRFDVFLQKLPAGVQLFSLFKAHPSLLKHVAQIMGMAPELADSLAGNPALLDGVLTTDYFGRLPDRMELAEDLDLMLSTARDFQDVLDISRRWANDLKFRVGVQILNNVDHESGDGATVTAGPEFSDVADVILTALFPKVREELTRKHGDVPGGELGIVAMGKLGSRQMTPGSDADLIFVFDTPEEGMTTNGEKPIPAGLFFTRLSQRYINALSALTGEGTLYEVDMRLRPHGKSGPIALKLDAFKKYYSEEAWTWEHMALSRGRVVAGSSKFLPRVSEVLQEIIRLPHDMDKLKTDITSMRARVHKEHAVNSIWSIKHVIGGLMDAEFLCQFFRLAFGHKHPSILLPNSIDCLKEVKRLQLIEPEETDRLIDIIKLYLNVSGLLQLCLGSRAMGDDAPIALQRALIKAANVENFDDLRKKLESSQIYVDSLVVTHIGTEN